MRLQERFCICLNHEAHDRIPAGIRHPFGGADRIALNQGRMI
jgi:hypothetical protein